MRARPPPSPISRRRSGRCRPARSRTTAPPSSRPGWKPMRADWSLVSSTTASCQPMSLSALTSASFTPQSPVMSIFWHRAAIALRLVEVHQAVGQRLARHHLQLRIERGAHRQPALVQLLLAVALVDLAAHFLGEILARRRYARRSVRAVTASGSFLAFSPSCARDVAVLDHAIDDVVAALDGALALAERMSSRWAPSAAPRDRRLPRSSARAPTCRNRAARRRRSP